MVSDLATDSTILFDCTWLLHQESPETRSNKHQRSTVILLGHFCHTRTSINHLLLNTKEYSERFTTQEKI